MSEEGGQEEQDTRITFDTCTVDSNKERETEKERERERRRTRGAEIASYTADRESPRGGDREREKSERKRERMEKGTDQKQTFRLSGSTSRRHLAGSARRRAAMCWALANAWSTRSSKPYGGRGGVRDVRAGREREGGGRRRRGREKKHVPSPHRPSTRPTT